MSVRSGVYKISMVRILLNTISKRRIPECTGLKVETVEMAVLAIMQGLWG